MRTGHSIRFTLTLQLTLFLFVVLTLFAVLILQRFQETLYNDTDVLLKSKVEGLEASIGVFWDFYNRTRITEQNFSEIAKDWIETRNSNSLIGELIVRIYKPDGTLIASNRRDLEEVKISREFIKNLRAEKSILQNASIKNFIGFEVRMRSFLTYVESRKQDYIIQTALENKVIEEPLTRLRVVILLLLPLFLVVGALLEWALVHRSLRTLQSFMNGLKETGVENLHLRFDVQEFDKIELQNLAQSFNLMMDRIDGAFSHQRRVFEDLSHQMKTPLAVMRGELEIALKKERSTAAYKDILSSSLEEVERMSAIVENLLKLARFDAQELRLDPTHFLLRDALEELLEQLEKLADSRQIVLDLDCAEDLLAYADRFKFQQAILNLLDNAIKYARSKTIVTVRARRTPQHLWIEVHDIGAVIPGEELSQVFERFWRSISTMKEKGYGLGLSIVKALIEMHGGSVTVESSEDRGTSFHVKLPQP